MGEMLCYLAVVRTTVQNRERRRGPIRELNLHCPVDGELGAPECDPDDPEDADKQRTERELEAAAPGHAVHSLVRCWSH